MTRINVSRLLLQCYSEVGENKGGKMSISAKGEEKMKECNRCGTLQIVTTIGFKLLNFVCDSCRNDNSKWDFRVREAAIPIKVEDMEACMPEPETAVKKARHYSIWNYKHGRGDKQDFRITWADGTRDASDKCDMCQRHDCHYPVHGDHYKEVNKAAVQKS